MASIPIIILIAIASHLLPILVGFKGRIHLLCIIPLVSFAFDVLITVLKRGMGINSQWLGNLFLPAEFILVSLLYQKYVLKARPSLFFLFMLCMCLGFIVHTSINSAAVLNKFGGSAFYFTYMLYSMLGFYMILKKQDVIHIERSWKFWTNVTFLLYASGDFFLLLFAGYLKKTYPDFYTALWQNVWLTLTIVKNLLLGIAVYYYNKSERLESS